MYWYAPVVRAASSPPQTMAPVRWDPVDVMSHSWRVNIAGRVSAVMYASNMTGIGSEDGSARVW